MQNNRKKWLYIYITQKYFQQKSISRDKNDIS